MTAKLMEDLLKPKDDAGLAEAMDGLSKKFDQMIRLMDDQVHLQRVSLLEPGHVLRFYAHDGQQIALSLPDAQDDYVQRVILRTHTFYEAKLLSIVQSLGLIEPASAVCDVGANIGNHTVYFGRILGAAKVLAFEPQVQVHATLTTNIALNGMETRATAYNCLVGAVTGQGRMARFNARNLGGTAFQASEDGGIPMFALDDVITAEDLAHLDLIKIDVEGMQAEVLKGAAGILDARKPALWVEILEKDRTGTETLEYLARFGYRSEKLGPNDWLFRV